MKADLTLVIRQEKLFNLFSNYRFAVYKRLRGAELTYCLGLQNDVALMRIIKKAHFEKL